MDNSFDFSKPDWVLFGIETNDSLGKVAVVASRQVTKSTFGKNPHEPVSLSLSIDKYRIEYGDDFLEALEKIFSQWDREENLSLSPGNKQIDE